MSAAERDVRLLTHLLDCTRAGITGPEVFLRWVEAEMGGVPVDWPLLTMAVTQAFDLKHLFRETEGETE